MPGEKGQQLLRIFEGLHDTVTQVGVQNFFKLEEGRTYREPLIKFVTAELLHMYGETEASRIANLLIGFLKSFEHIKKLINEPALLAAALLQNEAQAAAAKASAEEQPEEVSLSQKSVMEIASGSAIMEGLRTGWSKSAKFFSDLFSTQSDEEKKQELVQKIDTFLNSARRASLELPSESSPRERKNLYVAYAELLLDLLFSQYDPRTGGNTVFSGTSGHNDPGSYIDSRREIISSAVKELLSMHGLEHVYDHTFVSNVNSRASLCGYLRTVVVVHGFGEALRRADAQDRKDRNDVEKQAALAKVQVQVAAATRHAQQFLTSKLDVKKHVGARSQACNSRDPGKSFYALCVFLLAALTVLLALIPLLHFRVLPTGLTRGIAAVCAETLVVVSVFALSTWLACKCRDLKNNQQQTNDMCVEETTAQLSLPTTSGCFQSQSLRGKDVTACEYPRPRVSALRPSQQASLSRENEGIFPAPPREEALDRCKRICTRA
ncbi:MAG: hypothetical protein ACTJLK_03850 [Anaplasma sp.]